MQSNISKGNIETAAAWTIDTNAEVATLATLVIELGRVHPRRRKRHGNIRRNHPELFRRMAAVGIVFEWPDTTDGQEPEDHVVAREEDDPFSGFSVEDDIPF